MTPDTVVVGTIGIGLILVLALLPAIASTMRKPDGFTVMAIILCGLAALMPFGNKSIFGEIMAALIWLAAFLCGLTGAIISRIQDAVNEISYRLLTSDDRGLRPPPEVRKQQNRDR